MQNEFRATQALARRTTVPLLVAVMAALSAQACGSKSPSNPGSTTEPVVTEPEADAPNTEGLRIHQDLMSGLHLADVDHHGLFIDFGTPAHGKYTFGDWSGNNNSSNWASDGEDGDTTFTYVGARGRVYFHADRAEAMVARVRLKSNPGVSLTAYINNTILPGVPLTAGAYRDVDLVLPADKVVAGDNYLLLTFGGAAPGANGQAIAAAIDSIRVVPGAQIPAGDFHAPTYESLLRNVELGGAARQSIVVRRPTTLSYYVHVPEHTTLGFSVGHEGQGTANVKVVGTADGGQPVELFTHAANDHFRGATVDLQRFANQIVRLDFVADEEGAGSIVWNQPALYTPNPEATRMRPARNVIVLLIDTLRADRLHVYNESTRVRTPTMDALGPQGALFTNAHSVENWTKPSVASVLTGLYPRTHRARTQEAILPAGALMLSEHLHANSFQTASFIANGYVSDRFGFKQGWDYYTNYIRENKGTDAEIVFREAGDWIEQHKSERFFAYIHTIDPHVPYDPPAEYLRMYDARTDYAGVVRPRSTGELLEQAKRNPPAVQITPSDQQRLEALHDGEITQHDAVMGRFIERMKTLGLWEDTLFIITADHGEEFRDHNSWGHGHSVYEELLHVPLYVRYPRAVGGGLRIADSVGPISIPSTVTELTGVPPMPNVEASSLVDYFRSATPVGPRVAFSDWNEDRRVITVAGRYKLIVRGNFTATFFDLQADPREQTQIELATRPIAVRFCRIYLGAFNGATNRARYLEANQGQGQTFQQSNAVIDETARQELGALGYVTN